MHSKNKPQRQTIVNKSSATVPLYKEELAGKWKIASMFCVNNKVIYLLSLFEIHFGYIL